MAWVWPTTGLPSPASGVVSIGGRACSPGGGWQRGLESLGIPGIGRIQGGFAGPLACYTLRAERGMSPDQCRPNVGQFKIGGAGNAFFPMFGG